MESLARGKPVYMDPRYMRTDCAAEQLLEACQKETEAANAKLVEDGKEPTEVMSYNEDTPCIGLARIGTSTQKIVSGTLKSFFEKDLGEPMHSFIICGDMHDLEEDMYKFFE